MKPKVTEINSRRFAWLKSLKEKPNFMLGRKETEDLNNIALVYEREYASYFNLLLKQIPVGSIDYIVVQDSINDCRRIAKQLSVITHKLPGTLTNDELADLPMSMENVAEAIKQLIVSQTSTQDLTDAIKTVQDQYGVSPEDIKKQYSRTFGKAAKAGSGSKLKEVGSSLVEGSKGLLDSGASALITSLLGPAAPLGAAAYGAGKGLFNLMMSRKSNAASSPLSRISGSLSGSMFDKFNDQYASGRPVSDKTAEANPRGRASSNIVMDPIDTYRPPATPKPQPVPNYEEDIPVAEPTGQKSTNKYYKHTGAKVGNRSGTGQAMYDFFNVRAFQARWTKEVLEELKKIAINTSNRAEGGCGIADVGKKFLGILGPIALIVAAIYAQVKAFDFLKDKVGKTAARGIASGPSTMVSEFAMDFASKALGRSQSPVDEEPMSSQKESSTAGNKQSGASKMQQMPRTVDGIVLDYNKLAAAFTSALDKQKKQATPATIYSSPSRRDVRNSGDELLDTHNVGKLEHRNN